MNKKSKSIFSFLYNNKVRSILFQIITILAVIYLFYQAVDNMFINAEKRGIHTGFSFLTSEAGFNVADSLGVYLLDYTSASSVLRLFFVGIINTLVVSFIGIILASILGLIIGIARLSSNWLISRLATAYIEIFRNIPVLLQILLWYNVLINVLPHPRKSFSLFDSTFINLRGMYMPQPITENGFIWVAIAFVIAIVGYRFMKRYFHKKHDETGVANSTIGYSLLLIVGLPSVVYFLVGSPMHFDYPVLKGFNFRGGMYLSPELLALAFALSVYTATYIAEAIRAGVESVDKGQKEAAASAGLTQSQALKLVVLPQALRVAIPPIINQYLNLAKNSSLAAAIGFPELVSIFAGTLLNTVGQAVEIILMTMLVYLVISLLISIVLNIINHKMSIKGR